MYFRILVNDIERANGVTGKDALALINAFALQGDGTEEITAVLERDTERCPTPFEPREVR